MRKLNINLIAFLCTAESAGRLWLVCGIRLVRAGTGSRA